MATLKELISRIENLSQKENGAKYTLSGKILGKELSEIRSFLLSHTKYFSSAFLETNAASTLDLLTSDVPSEIVPDEKYDFKLELDKNKEDSFPIVSVPCFLDHFRESFASGTGLFGFINNAFNNPVLVDRGITVLKHYDCGDASTIADIFCKTVNFVRREDIKTIAPQIVLEDFETDGDVELERVKHFYKSLTNAYALMFLASNIELNDNRLLLKIDGYKEVECELTSPEIESNFARMSVYHDMSRWIFAVPASSNLETTDSKLIYLERIGIARNVFSLEVKPYLEDKSGLYKVSESLLNKCKSSYSVFLKSKTKEYFDLRMKLEEHVEKLVRNLSEESTVFVNSFRNNMYIFISLVFSTLLLTYSRNIGTQGFNDFIGRDDVSFVIKAYSVINIIFILMSSFRLHAANKAIIQDKENFKARYNKLLDKNDTEEIVESAFKTRLSSNKLFFWIIIIMWFGICCCLFFNQNIYSYFKTI